MALAQKSRGKYKHAGKMNRRALKGKENAPGKEHPDILASVSHLATILQDQRKHERAEEMDRKAVEGYRKERAS